MISVLYLPVFDGFVALSHWIYFLADLLIYYATFLLFSYIFKKSKNRLLNTALAILIVDVIIIIVLSVINYSTGSGRYLRACLCFQLGLICANFYKNLSQIVKENKLILFVTLVLVSVFTTLFAVVPSFDASPLKEYLLPVAVTLALIVALYGVNKESKVVNYLSSLVIYVYVSHEFFLNLFKELLPKVDRNLIGLIVFACATLFAVITNSVIKFIKSKAKPNSFIRA